MGPNYTCSGLTDRPSHRSIWSPQRHKCCPPNYFTIPPMRRPSYNAGRTMWRHQFIGGTSPPPWLPSARCLAVHSSFSLAMAVYQRAAAQAGAEPGQVDAEHDNHGHGALHNRTHRISFLFFPLPFALFTIPDAWRNWRNTFVCLPHLNSFIQAPTATPLTRNTYPSISAVILFCL